MIEYVVYGLVMIGVSWSSYCIGIKDGGAKMIDMLEMIGILNVDEHDNVSPNKAYDPSSLERK